VWDYIDAGIGNYDVLHTEHPNISKQEGENSFEGFWKMFFDGACSKFGSGVGIVFEEPQFSYISTCHHTQISLYK